MDHKKIEEQNLVELYALGRLSAAEQQRFEEHFSDCVECQEKIEAAQDLGAALRVSAAREITEAVRFSFWLRLLEELRRPRLTLMVVALAAVFLLPRLWMLGQVESALAPSPRVIPTFELGLTRDAEPAAPLRELVLPSGTEQAALLIEPGGEHRSYLVQLQDADGKVLWQEDGIERGAAGFLLLAIPGEMLQVGNYRLRLEGRGEDGRTEPLGNYDFCVKRPGAS